MNLEYTRINAQIQFICEKYAQCNELFDITDNKEAINIKAKIKRQIEILNSFDLADKPYIKKDIIKSFEKNKNILKQLVDDYQKSLGLTVEEDKKVTPKKNKPIIQRNSEKNNIVNTIRELSSIFSNNKKTEKELEIENIEKRYGLSKTEAELVASGKYEPWQFEEEELEEDDYYNEDPF